MTLDIATRSINGISGDLHINNDWYKGFLMFCLFLTSYNAIELAVMVFASFKRYRGLYFWSLLLSAMVGLIPYSVGFLLKFFTEIEFWLSCLILTIGWWVMVTGQSVVLYSRLHLVVRNQKRMKRVLCMIVIDAIILHIPTTVLTFGSNYRNDSKSWVNGYNVMEKIQMTGFTIQEFIISGLYLYETYRLLHFSTRNKTHQRIQRQLIAINILIILMDLSLLVLEYASKYAIQICLKGAFYSVKLKLEFAVLGQMVDFIRTQKNGYDLGGGVGGGGGSEGDGSGANNIPMDGTNKSTSRRQYVGQDAGLPSTRADDPHFYGQTTTMVMPSEGDNSSEERLNIPPGFIITKTEFTQRVDHKREDSEELE